MQDTMTCVLTGKHLDIETFEAIVFQNNELEFDDKAIANVQNSYEFLSSFCENKFIYGVNTGFGPMAKYVIPVDKRKELQLNLIQSHSTGMGESFPTFYIRAIMLARLNSLSLGYSGVHPDTVKLLRTFINEEIYPIIPKHGGVGASGDLVQLAHLALGLSGYGQVHYKGKIKKTASVLKSLGINPLQIHLREGLALMNGTSSMTGIGLINVIYAKKLIEYSIQISCMINEMRGTFTDHYSAPLNKVKKHAGQQWVAKKMREILKDSKLTRDRKKYMYSGTDGTNGVIHERVQEYYSLRCLPQILGPIYDTIKYTENVLIDELNSVNDNPIIDVKRKNVYHGGNFHGDYVSLEMDKLKIAVSKLSVLCERQINFLLNDHLNQKLPPFMNTEILGLNFGYQGAQFTATSTTAENLTLSYPAYLHSIPNNNDNQDVVSMGTNSAWLCKKVIENSYEVISIELAIVISAIKHLGQENDISSASKRLMDAIEPHIGDFEKQELKYEVFKKIKNDLETKSLSEL